MHGAAPRAIQYARRGDRIVHGSGQPRGGVVVTTIWVLEDSRSAGELVGFLQAWLVALVTTVVAMLMVSNSAISHRRC
jgi:hypothetical protein